MRGVRLDDARGVYNRPDAVRGVRTGVDEVRGVRETGMDEGAVRGRADLYSAYCRSASTRAVSVTTPPGQTSPMSMNPMTRSSERETVAGVRTGEEGL